MDVDAAAMVWKGSKCHTLRGMLVVYCGNEPCHFPTNGHFYRSYGGSRVHK